MIEKLKYGLHCLLDLFYPKLCLSCAKNLSAQEELLCLHCEQHLPLTHYFDYENNPIEKLFWGRVKVSACGALYFFNKGEGIQRLMHQLKYRERKDVGLWLGKKLAREIMASNRFKDIELIVPIPLHPKKEFKRGYNQSMLIAKGIEEVSGVKCHDLLKRIENSGSQTRKGKYDRWLNVSSAFRVDQIGSLKNKNILLIDDVVTTGATLEAAVSALLSAGVKNVSIATAVSA